MLLAFFLLKIFVTLLALSHDAHAFRITGATGGINASSNSLPPRLEINTFAASGPPFDLYILALERFQALDQTDQLSYFQVAGIHGYPSIPWDGVVGGGSYPGYCMHNTVAFPLWHRPYLALFEQLVWTHAQAIAETYPVEQRQKYRIAAQTLRIPYWDWAIFPSRPQALTSPTISVNSPGGWRQMNNPLYKYEFHPGPEGNRFPLGHKLSGARYTTRWESFHSPSNTTDPIKTNAAGVLVNVYQLLSSTTDYSQFATVSPGTGTDGANSIEGIHNGLHLSIGGDSRGTMWYPEFAAFDPIFWLHHAQVDRLTTIWQTLNPSSYIVPRLNSLGSYYEPAGTTDFVNTVLAPFHIDSSTTMFTPASIQNTSHFGYTYPELIDASPNSNERQANLRRKVNNLYGTRTVVGKKRQSEPHKRAASVASIFSHISLAAAQELGVNDLEMQWSIRVNIKPFAHNESYAIDFFMGTPPKVASQWSTASNLIGTYGQFLSAAAFTGRRKYQSSVVSQGEVALTPALAVGLSKGFLDSLLPEKVVPVLKSHLHWKVRNSQSQEICPDELFGFTLQVQSRSLQLSKDPSEFPVCGEYMTHLVVPANVVGKTPSTQRRWQAP